jgi:flagellar biosynthesis GTPase FlhF
MGSSNSRPYRNDTELSVTRDGQNRHIKMVNDGESKGCFGFRYTVSEEVYCAIRQEEIDGLESYNRSHHAEPSNTYLKNIINKAKERVREEEKRREAENCERLASQRRVAEQRQEEVQRQAQYAAELMAREHERRASEKQAALDEQKRLNLAAQKEKHAQDENYLTQYTMWKGLTREKVLEKLSGMPRSRHWTPRVMMLGRTNAGKTSLINAIYGLSLETAAVENTMVMKVVYASGVIEVVDTFGYNDGRPYDTAEMAMYLL